MIRKSIPAALVLALVLALTAGCGRTASSAAVPPHAKSSASSAASAAAANALPDGVYDAEFDTDSSMFALNEACGKTGTLNIKDGVMTIHVSLRSNNILNLYPGTAADAQKSGAILLQPTADTVTYSDGISEKVSGFDIPVPAIDEEFDVALVGAKGKWYDHKVSVKNPQPRQSAEWSALSPVSQMELHYASQFTVTKYSGGYSLITVANGSRYLVVPDGAEVPLHLPNDITVLAQPLDSIYLAATASMDFIRHLNCVGAVRLSGVNASGWYIDEAKKAMENGSMLYAGKYSAPDYETILANKCDLAVESTMIYHSPQVKEQLERLGIPVLVDNSSYEESPLGRMEWIKLYGVLLNKEQQAGRIFDDALAALSPALNQGKAQKTAAFFYITSNGTVNIRKSEDYVARMIKLAGGIYLPQTSADGDSSLSTVNTDMESFYAAARDADILIYNSTVDGELQSLDQLLAKSPLLADFKAVKNGDVWCTGKSMFQETMGLANMIMDLNAVFTQQEPRDLHYLYRLK